MTISFSGLASGLDTSSWVESLVKLKQAKIDTLQEEKEGIELTKDTLENIKSFFSSFRSMLEKVTDSKFGIAATDLFAQNLATSANLDIFTATATTEAEESTYNVLVDQLATNSAAKSNYSYMTTIIQTTTATADSKLINLGVKAGNIGVKVNGIERGIEITDSDTISSFIEKLQNIGVNASFNDKTGIFSMDISSNDINDIDKTGIVNAFKLSGVNEGYTSNSLKITSTDTVYSAATNDTKLSELGAHAGTLTIKANDAEYQITIDENTTLGEFIKGLNDNKISASLDKTGVLTIVDANITNEGTTNIKNALGLELDIYSNTQKSNDLSHKTIITQTTTATSDTLLKDLGVEIKDNQTVIVKNSNNEYTTITVGTSTTLGDLLTKISNAGLYAAIDTEGRVEISGGTITGGTFNAIKALGLTSEPYSAITTGKPLTETVRKAELVTLETKLVDEMKVRAGYIEVTDNDGNKFYEKIYHGQTIADFMSDMGNLGIYTKLRDDGVLEITGGAFATLSDDKVQELIANGTIRETDDRYKQGTDLLTCLYGSPVISTDQITVASTYSKSRALTKTVVNTIAASLTSTLGNLSLQADGTAIFDVRGDKRTIEVAKTDTLQNLMDKLKNVGIASSWNSNTQQFTIENATLEGGTANLGSVLNLTKTISGKYVTSNSLNKLETVTIDATRSTTLNKYGISNSMSDAERTVKLFDNNAKLVGSLTVTESTTIGDVLDFVNKNSGMKASIVDGILQIEGGYIENAALEKSMGLTTENKSSFALGSIMTVTTVAAVTGNTTLGQIISTLGTADAVKDGYSLTFNSKSLSVSATTTLDQLISQIFTNGGSASLDNTGRLSISGGVVAGSVATALGITSVSTTTAVSATGKTLVTTKTEYADLETKLSDVGVSDNSTIILHNKLGSAYKTITVNGSTTVKDVFASLKAEGIDGTISNGVISLKSAEYKYITGTVATALGIGTQTVTDVVNTSVYSTSKVTFTGSGLADGTTAIGSIVGVTADNNKLTIKDKNNNTIGTVTVTNTTTLDELFGMLAKFDITGKVSDGVISFDSPSGNYVQGGLVNSWGMTASTVIVTTTVGKTSTSTAAISHTVTRTADISSTLAQLGINKGNTLIVHKTDGGTATVTVSGSTTLDSLFDSLDNHGVQGVVAEGIITFTSVDGAYLTDASGSDLLSKLGVTTATETVTTTTTKGTAMTSGSLTYTGTESATLANKVLSYTTFTTNQTVTVKDSDGNTKGSVTVTENTTFSDLFKALDDLGIQGTMEDGMVTLTSNNGFYATGGVLTALGIEAKTATITTTVGKTTTSTAAISHTVTRTADISSTLAQLGINKGNTLIVHKTDGGTATVTVSGSTTLDSLFDSLDNHGVQGVVAEGIITFTSVDGAYLTDASGSDLLSKLGVTTATETVTTTTTKGTAMTSGSLTYTGTESATLANKVLSYTTFTTNQTVTVKDSDGNTKGSVTVTENTTFSDLFKALDDLGIQGTMEDGMVTLTSNNGSYATGGVLTALGIEAKTMLTTITVGTTNTSTAAVTYTDTFVATESTLVGSCIDLSTGNTLVVNSGQQKALATITVSATTTFKDLMDALKENGIDSTFVNGVLSLKSEVGNYVTGDVADKLGISLIKFIGMGTGGGSGSSTIEGGSTVDTALIGQLAYFLGSTTTINIKSSDGTVIATQEFYGYAKIDDLIRFFTKYGISAEVRDNILCLDNNEGIYAEDATTGGFLTQIGVGVTTKAVATSFLKKSTTMTVDGAIAMSTVTSLVAGNTYAISSASDLVHLQTILNRPHITEDHWSDTTKTTYQSTTGCIFVLTQNIDMSSVVFYGLGVGTNFNGTFFGNGCKISNLSITTSNTTINVENTGFFASIGQNGAVYDLGFENVIIGTTGQYNYANRKNVGGLAGSSSGKINNCYIKNIKIEEMYGAYGSVSTRGGLVGYSKGGINNSHVSGSISITGPGYSSHNGGLAGGAEGGNIANCFVDASMTGVSGGLVGETSYVTITNCSTSGSISKTNNGIMGGMIGVIYHYTYITKSNSSVNLNNSVKDNDCRMGGFIGNVHYAGRNIKVSQCFSTGNVTNAYGSYDDSSGDGGFVGIHSNSSDYFYNTSVITFTDCYATGKVTAGKYSGGFFGSDISSLEISTNCFNNCYASGIVDSGYGFGCTTYTYSSTNTTAYYNSANTPTNTSSTIASVGTGITLTQMQNKDTMVANGFTEANGWTYETGKTPTISGAGCNKTFASKILPVNTNSKNLQEIIDNGISSSKADGGLAITSDMLGSLVNFPADNLTINIKDSSGVVISSQSFNKYSSVSELLKFFNDNGIDAYMKDGVIYLDNDKGLYAEDAVAGGILSQMQISTTTKSVAISSLMTTIEEKSIANALSISDVTTLQAGHTYAITSTKDLKSLEYLVNSGQTGANCMFILTQDLNLLGDSICIGNGSIDDYHGTISGNSFSGYFYGNGHKISNFKSNQTASGLFGILNNGLIQDLIVENASISGKYTGALAGGLAYGTIKNCSTQGDIKLFSTGSDGAAGGVLIGISQTTSTSSTSSTCLIENIYVNGAITTAGVFQNVGGIIGSQNGTITKCYVNAKISATAQHIGGIAGSLYSGSITSCTTTGELVSDAVSDYYDEACAGGILGYFSLNVSNGNHLTHISNLSSSMNITSKGCSGGIVGYYSATYSYNDSISNCNASGAIKGGTAGGIIGKLNASNTTVKNCWASGDVTGSSQAGGFVGFAMARGYSESQYNGTIKIQQCLASGNVNGDSSLTGGFVGKWERDYLYDSENNDSKNYGNLVFTSCYATGTSSSGYGFYGFERIDYDYSNYLYGNTNNYYNSTTNSSFGLDDNTEGHGGRYFSSVPTGMTSAELESDSNVRNIKNSSTAYNLKINLTQNFQEKPVNTNSMILYRTYTPGSGGSGGGGGSVVVTILTNSTSDQQSYKSLTQMTTETLFKMLGFSDSTTGYITVVSGGTQHVVTIKSSDTIDDILTTLAGFSVSGSVHDGKLTLTGTSNGYVAGASDNVKTALKIETGSGKTYTTSTKTSGFNTVSNKLSHSVTYQADGNTLLSKINQTGTISGVYKGQAFSVTASAGKTIGDVLTELAGYGISGSIENGVIKLVGTPEGYITNAGGAFGLTGSAYTTTTTSIVSGVNSNSNKQVYSSTVSINPSSTFSQLGMNANGTMVINNNGKLYTVTAKTTDTLDSLLTTIAGLGIAGSIADGKLTLAGTADGFISSMSDNLKTALKLNVGSGNSYSTSTKTSGFNTVSNKLSHSVTYQADGNTLLSKINQTGTISGVYKGQAFSVTASAGKTIGDVLTELAGYGISGSIENGVIKLVGTPEGYITNAGGAFGLTGSAYTTTTTSIVSGVNSNSNKQVYSSTVSINPSSTFSQLGMNANGTMVINNNGKLYTVTAKTTDTLDSLLTTIAGLGIAGSIADGKLTLAGTADGFISSMSDNLKTALKLNVGSGNSYSTSTKTICSQGTSGNLGYVSTNAALTSSTKLSNINGFANGNGKLVIHQTNGQFVTISIDATKTLGEFFTDISRYGLVGNINDGKVSIEGIGNVYMQATDGGSNILTALKLSNVIQNVQTVTVNRTSNILSHTVTVAASGTTQLGNLADSLGNTIGSGNGTIVLSTTSNAGNQNVTLTFDRTKSIYDVIDALASYGINASLDALGKFSINSSTLTDFSISGNLGTLLMGTYTKVYGKGETFNISTNLVEKTTLPMSKTDLLSSFGITNGNILITQQGVNYTVNIDTTQVKTVADFMKLLASYGFESDIDSAGRLYVSGIGKSYLSSISGGSNILDKFGLTNWSLGDVKQESKHLGDYKVNNITCSLDTKLNQLTDASGSNLGISSGNIYVYQDGTRYLVNIDNNDTLQTLSAKLAQYGITMGLSTDGKLYFDGTNDSYMTTDGITNGASNILNRLNIAGNWSTRYDSTSENLSYTTTSNNVVSGSTKLADLQDSDGNNLGITTGAFYVYNSGSRSTESITADMTVNDLMATLAKHGLVADIAEDGSISIGAYNNTYLATSALTSDNSNIVSKLFSEWDFVNIYTSKGLDIPVDEVKSINRNTKLSAINEGKYQDGYITVVKDGVQTNIKLTSDDTVGTLMDELSLYGFESVINEKGQLLIKNTGNSLLQKYTGTEQASNALELLGIDLNNWIQTSSYKSDTLKVTQTSTIDSDVTRDTLLSELGVTTGEYNIFKNGVKYTAYISTGETMGSFLDTLKSFGIETSLVSDGDSSILTIIGSGDTYIAKSNSTTGASNVVEKLFANNDKYSSFRYKGLEQTSETVTHFTAATKDTLLSEFNKKDGSNTLTSIGDLSVTVNGETATIKIEADETFGSLIEKFKALGLEASISSTGQLMIQSGYNTFTINSDGTNSNLLSNVGLVYHNDLGGYVASTDTLKATTTTIEEKTFSVANYANYNTKMSLMNISSGTLSVYLNGQKATIKIDKNQTFGDLRSLVSTEFADVDLTFEDGYIKFYSKKDGDKVEVGATTDTSNFAAITGITSDGNGAVKSARELFCVNNSSVITNSGLFRKGDVTKGTFTVGNATFTIDDKTTISDIISQINSNDEANATAYWDSIEGNFVIKSRTTGSALINIEAGTSNFTDIMGFTNSEWAADGSLNVTRMNTASQEVGNNAKFSINGTYYTSTSNNITSDVSRIKGLTINLKGLTDGSAITLTVERDKETLANAVSDIVDSYNELMDNVDKEITKDGKLKDQSTLKLIRNQLRSLMTSSDAGTTIFRNLDAIGIKVEAASGNNISTSGLTTLTFDKDKFFEAFKSDQNAVKDLLVGSANNTGIFTKVENLVESSLKSVSGYFESADKSYQKQINNLDNKIEKQKTALERYRAQLESKFSSMDILIANMQQQYSSFLRT